MVRQPKTPKTLFHLTVSKEGIVSLWDSRVKAASATDESYLALSLTDAQIKLIENAIICAKSLPVGKVEL